MSVSKTDSGKWALSQPPQRKSTNRRYSTQLRNIIRCLCQGSCNILRNCMPLLNSRNWVTLGGLSKLECSANTFKQRGVTTVVIKVTITKVDDADLVKTQLFKMSSRL
ncbi:hypothetical protein CEXT_250721 [Caerostris extrusa]|uniref:Uncharacterized protein n=1 Tax=Caerostris extrusa TaxID=172846 RepID=A0AAV4PQA1_CAEEX|nr:hypothetical protein CEXT_250721 [Caerostris extrusa]